MVVFGATGGRLRSGEGIVELIGPFAPAVVATDGQVLAPMAAPNCLLCRARAPGSTTIEVVTGDPWGASRSTSIAIAVGP